MATETTSAVGEATPVGQPAPQATRDPARGARGATVAADPAALTTEASIPRGDRRARQRERQRERILGAAERLLVTSGVERTRLRDVADAAGVSIGTVQHYFDTRDRLVAELFEWSAARRLEAWVSFEPDDSDPWRRVETLLEHAIAEPVLYWSRIWMEFVAMARDEDLRPRLEVFYEAWRRPFREAIDAGIAAGMFHPLLAVDVIVDLMIMQVDGGEVAAALAVPGMTADRLRSTLVASARALLGVRLGERLAAPQI